MAAFVLYNCVQGLSRALVTAVKIGLPIALIVVAIVTIPIVFIRPDALSYQGTTTEAEFSATMFASTTINQFWTGDDHITRIESNYHGSEHNAGPSRVYNWMQGSNPLDCPVVGQDSWTTLGAQLYPEINIGGTLNVLEAARQNDTEQVVVANSSSVYGKPVYLPYDEDHPTTPVNPYSQPSLLSRICNQFNFVRIRVNTLEMVMLYKSPDPIADPLATHFLDFVTVKLA